MADRNMSQPKMRDTHGSRLPSLSIRIDLEEVRIEPGKIQLLELIRDCGSISAAGRAMNMSYRHAWGLVGDINRMCGRDAVERQVGGMNGGGTVLTSLGFSLIARCGFGATSSLASYPAATGRADHCLAISALARARIRVTV
jgi:molybdate transport system regulatory protein